MNLTIGTFYGLAPNLGDNLPQGWATQAQNLDLSSGKIRPLAKHKRISTAGGGVNDLYYWNGSWQYGNDRFFAEWNYETRKLLFSLSASIAKRKVGGTEDDLGQDLPSAAPTVALNGAGDLSGIYQYFWVTKRTVGGFEDLSGASDASEEITASSNQIRVTRGSISDSDVTHWWIYRTSSNTGTWNFVAEVNASATYYDDNISDDDVGEGPTTYFVSPSTSTQLVLQAPPSLDGLVRELHAGMLVGWRDSDIYLSEPVMPDLWEPDAYRIRSPYPVLSIIELSGMLVVLTQWGPYRLEGTDPELMAFRKGLSTEPAVNGRAAIDSQRGLYYLSDSGIVLFDSIGTQIFSDTEFNEEWFTANVNPVSAWMAENDDRLYLGHSGGILVCDQRKGARIWYTLDTVATAAHRRADDGKLYLSMTDGIYELHGLPYFMASDYLTWTWRSGDLTFGTEADKYFGLIRVRGSGEVSVSGYVDGTQVGGTKQLVFNGNCRDRSLLLPRTHGRALQVELTGTGQVDELYVEAST